MLDALFGFGGRIGRLAYFGHSIVAYILTVVLMGGGLGLMGALIGWHGTAEAAVIGAIAMTAGFAFLLSPLALMTKRLHDIGMSGGHLIWILGIQFALTVAAVGSPPVAILSWLVGLVINFWLLFAPGTPGNNRYGSSRRKSRVVLMEHIEAESSS